MTTEPDELLAANFDRLSPLLDFARTERARRFLDPAARMPRYVVGRNPESEFLRTVVPIEGLIDDRADLGTLWQGLPVVGMDRVPRDAWVMNTSTSIAPVAVTDALHRAGLNQHLNLSDLLALPEAPADLTPWFVKDQRAELAAHRSHWVALFERLEDPESRKVLSDVVRFRLSADPRSMGGYALCTEDQYFEDFLSLHDEVFVDAGGFDGDTTEQFCLRTPQYRKVHLFEPSSTNIAAARRRLADRPRIEFHPIGLSDTRAQLRFDAAAGSASAISMGGGESIHVDRLDALISEPVSFIKMDLEGWEMHALRGSATTISRHRPKLAIAVYHQASHFREVPQFVLGLNPHYKIRLRHYTQGWSETVMFFIH